MIHASGCSGTRGAQDAVILVRLMSCRMMEIRGAAAKVLRKAAGTPVQRASAQGTGQEMQKLKGFLPMTRMKHRAHQSNTGASARACPETLSSMPVVLSE